VKDRRPDYFKPHDETADHATVMPEWVNDELDGGTHLTCNLSFNVSGREFIGADSNKSSEEITVTTRIYATWFNTCMCGWPPYTTLRPPNANVLNVYIYLTNICKRLRRLPTPRQSPAVNHRQREYGFHVVVKEKTRYACIGGGGSVLYTRDVS
jgi:hypothetical protein